MRISSRTGFWVVALAFLVSMAYSTVPTPLYAIYQDRDDFPTVVITVIFAAYAVGVVASLFFVGHVSDWIGRKPVLLASLGVQLVSIALFVLWPEVPGLIVARFVNGVGIGALTATATAQLAELAAGRPGGPTRAALVATLVNMGGLGLGPMIGGAFASWVDEPLVTPFLVFAVLFVVLAALLILVPETVPRTSEPHPYRPQRISMPSGSRGLFWAAALATFGAFAVLGLFTALAPTFLVGSFHENSRLVAGVVPGAVFVAGALAQVLVVRRALDTQLSLAIGLVTLGLAGVTAGAVLGVLAVFATSGVLAGAGVGILFRVALATTGGLADPERRGETIAAVFLVAYTGLTVPVLLTGAALLLLPQLTVLMIFSALVIALVAVTGGRMLRRARAGQ